MKIILSNEVSLVYAGIYTVSQKLYNLKIENQRKNINYSCRNINPDHLKPLGYNFIKFIL